MTENVCDSLTPLGEKAVQVGWGLRLTNTETLATPDPIMGFLIYKVSLWRFRVLNPGPFTFMNSRIIATLDH